MSARIQKEQRLNAPPDKVFLEEDKTEMLPDDIAPVAIGAQILNAQRLAIIRFGNALKKLGITIMSADTDAIISAIPWTLAQKYPLLLDPDEETAAKELCRLVKGSGVVYGKGLGQWHSEKDAKEGIGVERKVYAYSKRLLSAHERTMTYAALIDKGRRTERGELLASPAGRLPSGERLEDWRYIGAPERPDARNMKSGALPEGRLPLYSEQIAYEFYTGTRGVKKKSAMAQLTPDSWRKGATVWTPQWRRFGRGRIVATVKEKALAALPPVKKKVKHGSNK